MIEHNPASISPRSGELALLQDSLKAPVSYQLEDGVREGTRRGTEEGVNNGHPLV